MLDIHMEGIDMRKKSNKSILFFEMVVVLLVFALLGVTIITALDILGIVEIPQKYSLAKYLATSTEISSKEYTEIIKNPENEVLRTEDKEGKDETENENKVDDEEFSTELPEGLESIYDAEKQSSNNNIEKYYYSQLNEYGKIIYDKMYMNTENLKTGNYNVRFDNEFNSLLQQDNGSDVLDNAFQSALNALIYDNPGMFYLDITKMYLYTETTTIVIKKIYKVYIGPEEGKTYLAEGFNSKQDVENAINLINEKVEEIKLTLAGTAYTKMKKVHDYLVDNIEYDQTISEMNIYNIYGALVQKRAVCEGYAKAFKYILDELEINSMLICGIGTNSKGESENHAWNYIKLNNVWYAVDVTWDDPIIIGGGTLTDSHRYKYFLKGSNEFYVDHTEDGNIIDKVKFYYPVLSQNNY